MNLLTLPLHLLSLTPLTALTTALITPDSPPNPTITITIDAITTHQTISGFGFSEAFQRAHALTNLPPPLQTQLLDLLFNTTTGAGFSILRIGLGSSPNSTLDHMNSPQPTADGPFAFDHNDSGQLWVARQAHERYNITTFYADAWSAPGYMKTNGRDDMGGWLCGVRGAGQDPSDTNNNCQGASWVQSYAEYLARYVLAYIDAGIPISYVGFLNEPNLVKPYATMLADGYQAADIIAALYVALGGIGLPHVGIACCEAQGWSYAREMLAELEDAGAVDGLSLMTTHAYKGEPAAPDGPLGVTSMPVWITENSPIMQRLGMTETWYGNGSENEGLAWAVNIHEAIVRGNVSAYVYWIGVGQSRAEAPLVWAPSTGGADGSVWGETSGGSATTGDGALPAYTIGATYWASAQFSRFIRPGAKRIGVGQDWMEGSVLVSAYENKDGSVVVQAVNNGDEDVDAVMLVSGLLMNDTVEKECWVETWLTDNSTKFGLVGKQKIVLRGRFGRLPFVVLSRRSLMSLVVRCSSSG